MFSLLYEKCKGRIIIVGLILVVVAGCQSEDEFPYREQIENISSENTTSVEWNGKEIIDITIYENHNNKKIYTMNDENFDTLQQMIELLSYGVKVSGETEVEEPNYRIQLNYANGQEDIAYLWLSNDRKRSSFYMEGEEKQIFLLSELMTDKLKKILLNQ